MVNFLLKIINALIQVPAMKKLDNVMMEPFVKEELAQLVIIVKKELLTQCNVLKVNICHTKVQQN